MMRVSISRSVMSWFRSLVSSRSRSATSVWRRSRSIAASSRACAAVALAARVSDCERASSSSSCSEVWAASSPASKNGSGSGASSIAAMNCRKAFSAKRDRRVSASTSSWKHLSSGPVAAAFSSSGSFRNALYASVNPFRDAAPASCCATSSVLTAAHSACFEPSLTVAHQARTPSQRPMSTSPMGYVFQLADPRF